MELAAVSRIFPADLVCSSSKSLVGHTLGAAGALSAAFGWMLLKEKDQNEIPVIPHIWDGERDPTLPPIRLASKGMRVPRGPVMSNAFGFGGNNCSLILSGSGE